MGRRTTHAGGRSLQGDGVSQWLVRNWPGLSRRGPVRDARDLRWASLAAVLMIAAGTVVGYAPAVHAGEAVGMLALAAALWQWPGVAALTATGEVVPRVVQAGGTVRVRFVVHAWRLPWFRVGVAMAVPPGCAPQGERPAPWVVMPGSPQVRERVLHCGRRGVLALENAWVVGTDPLGMGTRWTRVDAGAAELTVTPAIRPLEDVGIPPRRLLGELRGRCGFPVESEPGEVRPLTPGEAPRRIHWRQTARTGRLHVVDDIPQSVGAALFVPDLSTGGPEMEAGLSAAASVLWLLMEQGFRVGLYARDGGGVHHLPPRRGEAAGRGVLVAMARLAAARAARFADVALEASSRCPAETVPVIFCCSADGRLVRVAAHMIQCGRRPLWVQVGTEAAETRRPLAALGLQTHEVRVLDGDRWEWHAPAVRMRPGA